MNTSMIDNYPEGLNGNDSPSEAIRILLKISALVSFIIIAIGLGLAFKNGQHKSMPVPFNEIIHQSILMRPDAIISLGIVILLLIPGVGLFTAAVGYALRKKKEALLAAVNLFGLIIGYFVAKTVL